MAKKMERWENRQSNAHSHGKTKASRLYKPFEQTGSMYHLSTENRTYKVELSLEPV